MAGYYEYLISSLPMLSFGIKPPFSAEKLLSMCEGIVSGKDFDILSGAIHGVVKEMPGAPLAVRKWIDFEIALRNELVKIRAARKHVDASGFLRQDGYTDQNVSHIAVGAYRNQSIMDAERVLDHDRWRFLDELSINHYFDLELLVIYALKLSILERWERVRAADKSKLLEGALAA